jgi:hypothetical protein
LALTEQRKATSMPCVRQPAIGHTHAIVREQITDPVGSEFMAPPARTADELIA